MSLSEASGSGDALRAPERDVKSKPAWLSASFNLFKQYNSLSEMFCRLKSMTDGGLREMGKFKRNVMDLN